MSDLLPCPFCGRPAEGDSEPDAIVGCFDGKCPACSGPVEPVRPAEKETRNV